MDFRISRMAEKIMENRENREIILPQRTQRAQKLTDHGKPGKAGTTRNHANPDGRKGKISRFEIKIRIRIKSPRNTRLICRSGKSATRQQVLIVNDLSGNKIGNKPATDPLR
jgi:hypothetical protein